MNLTNSNLLNKHSCATLSGVFETQTLRVCPTEQIILLFNKIKFAKFDIHKINPKFKKMLPSN